MTAKRSATSVVVRNSYLGLAVAFCASTIMVCTMFVLAYDGTMRAGASESSVIQVGPTRELKTPSAASLVVKDGDVVEIDAGVYECDTGVRWNANNLTLRGVGGRAHLKAEGCAIPGGKGIWNPRGDNLIIENIEFSGARVGDRNGAGIRFDGGGEVIIKNSYFHHNENGILFTPHSKTTSVEDTHLTIEHSEFAFNGHGRGQTHNLYINKIGSLTFKYNYSHNSNVGHLLKTRAMNNFILYNRLSDERGTGSYNIDISDGGRTYVIGNLIEQGPKSPNYGLMSYAPEARNGGNPDKRLYIINNTIVNNHASKGSVFLKLYDKASDLAEVHLENNLVVGLPEDKLVSYQKNASSSAVTLKNNIFSDGSDLTDPGSYNYYLKAGSPAIDAGSTPGNAAGFSLVPDDQYLHLAEFERRPRVGSLDVGALEFDGTVSKPVTLSASIDATHIDFGSSVTLTWESENAVACEFSGPQTGEEALSGNITTPGIFTDSTQEIKCYGRGGSLTESFDITVKDSDAAEALPELSFVELPGTTLQPHFEIEDGLIKGVMRGWSGHSTSNAYDEENNVMYFVGGGQREYFGNEIYALDLNTFTLSQVSEQTNPRDLLRYNGEESFWDLFEYPNKCGGVWELKDGSKVSAPRNLYGQLVYHKSLNALFLQGGRPSCTSNYETSDGWLFHLNTKKWELLHESDSRLAGTVIRSINYDPQSELVVVGHNKQGGMFLYDAVQKIVKPVSASYPRVPGGVSSVVVQERNLILYAGREQLFTQDISGLSMETESLDLDREWTVTGDVKAIETDTPGLTYNPDIDMFVAWRGGDKFYFIDLDESTKTAHIITKTVRGGPTRGSSKIYNTFQYIPSLKAYLVFVDEKENFYLLKSSEVNIDIPDTPLPAEPVPEPEPISEDSLEERSNDDIDETATTSGETPAQEEEEEDDVWVADHGNILTGRISESGGRKRISLIERASTTIEFVEEAPLGTSSEYYEKEPETWEADHGNTLSGFVSRSGKGKRISLTERKRERVEERNDEVAEVSQDAAETTTESGGEISREAGDLVEEETTTASSGGSTALVENRAHVAQIFTRSSSAGTIEKLQQFLNRDPDTQVAASGEGAQGLETNVIGQKTIDAIARFQKKYNIVPLRSREGDGYGTLDARTRAVMRYLSRSPSDPF